MNVLFIGYGKMGGALGDAWLASGWVKQLVAIDPGLPQGTQAQVIAGVSQLQQTRFDLVVVAVKPAMARQVIESLPVGLWTEAVLISVMAGVSCEELVRASGGRAPVVRAMPNTPVMVNKGCTGLFSDTLLDESRRDLIRNLFAAVGVAVWVDSEEQMHAITALSGSGPAYYHLFSEALAEAGVRLGLPPELSAALAANTALGAATLQCEPDAEFEQLRLAVTSPNGTTAAAIGVFEAHQALRQLVVDATEAARQRSIELSHAG
ncbi:pyrroline-5-carboxylate reductase [Pseudomonas putida]|uniref:pyrroline-5-carboxylate reductase n=1 Tax=Pseudomonas putida TaxID=303 RepID=UPI003F3C22D1